ncbi:MAG: oligosaccharide flippase family protein, partial [Candidatus Pacearchaeota archaeon]|nr:oligosaccharide flippase family protein [Candidatus Pacearchaeota archaeon]
GLLGLGVFLTLATGSRMALLQGLRRVGDLARVNIIGSIVGASAGILLIYMLGNEGVLWFVLTAPAANIIVAQVYVARLRYTHISGDWLVVYRQLKIMFKIGMPLMLAAMLTLGTQLVARTLILDELGVNAAGYFQAAWTVSMLYLGFILSAMGSDYYPHLTGIIGDHKHAIRLVNQQMEMALLLAGPVLLAMITLAPWVIRLLYSDDFLPASMLLRWQVLGDVLKIVAWPMGFVVLAKGRSDVFVLTQLSWNAVYLFFLWYGLKEIGLVAAGIGFFVAYVVYAIVEWIVAGKLIGFSVDVHNVWMAVVLLVSGWCIVFLLDVSMIVSLSAGVVSTLLVAIYNINRLNKLMDMRDWVRARSERPNITRLDR